MSTNTPPSRSGFWLVTLLIIVGFAAVAIVIGHSQSRDAARIASDFGMVDVYFTGRVDSAGHRAQIAVRTPDGERLICDEPVSDLLQCGPRTFARSTGPPTTTSIQPSPRAG